MLEEKIDAPMMSQTVFEDNHQAPSFGEQSAQKMEILEQIQVEQKQEPLTIFQESNLFQGAPQAELKEKQNQMCQELSETESE